MAFSKESAWYAKSIFPARLGRERVEDQKILILYLGSL